MIQVFRNIYIKKLIETIISVISSSKKSVIYDESFNTQIYGLLGDLLNVMKNFRILEIEEKMFKAFLSTNFIQKLIKVQASKTCKGIKSDTSSTAITVVIELLLSSKMMSAFLAQEQNHVCPLLDSIVRSAVIELKRDGTFMPYQLWQFTAIYACLCKLCSKMILSPNSLTNIKGVKKKTTMKKRPINKQDIMKLMIEDDLIIPFTWGLVHSNISVKSNTEEIFIILTENPGCLFNDEGFLLYLLKQGYAQILYAVREKCRNQHRNRAINLVGKLLIGMRSKLLAKIMILNEKRDFNSCLELFNFICSTMKVKKFKFVVFKEFFILYADMIYEARDKQHTTFIPNNLLPINFLRDGGEDIFLYLQQTTRFLRHVLNDTKTVSSYHEIQKHYLEENDIIHKMVFANVFCKDKGITVMMECATLKKLMSNAPLLAQKVCNNGIG